MASFEITAPDGRVFDIDGENEQGALAALKKHLGTAQPQPIVATNEAETRKAERATGMTQDPTVGEALSGIWPVRLVQSMIDAAKLPGDVYAGRVDPRSDEGIGRAFDLASVASPAGPSVRSAPAAVPALSPRAELAESAGRVGMDLPVAALMPRPVQKVAAGLSDLPVVGAPLQRSADNVAAQAEERAGELARSGGASIQEGVKTFRSQEIPAIEREVFRPINKAIETDARFIPANTVQAISEIQGRLGQSAGKLGGEPARIQKALEENKGNLTFQALQDLRSALGAEMRAPLKREGYDEGAASRLYATLSNDLQEAARTAGGDDLAAAWTKANDATREAWQQLKSVRGMAGDNVSPNAAFQQAFALAMDKRGNAGKLAKLRQTVGPEAWRDVAATAVDEMGRNQAGGFSMQFFVNNHEKMSPSARNILFGDASRSVSDLAASFKSLQSMDRFKSKSQSANPLVLMGGGGAAMADPVSTALAGIAGYAGAKFLASPVSAKTVASWTKAYASFVRNPTAATARALNERAKLVGNVVAAEAAAPAAAPEIAGLLSGAVAAVAE
jgi:hypothetical protein